MSALPPGLRSDPGRTLLALDFDGTLAPIVTDPARAAPVDGAVGVLEALVGRGYRVVVVSGRPIEFLVGVLPDSIDLVGLYGLEGRRAGNRWQLEAAASWRPVLAEVADALEAAIEAARGAGADTAAGPTADLRGVQVERKQASLTVHYRSAVESGAGLDEARVAEAVHALVSPLAAGAGLDVRRARMSWEVHPPIHLDKGTVIRDVVEGCSAVLVAGDDVGDLPAFDAAHRAREGGVLACTVGVDSAEAPAGLRAAADVLVADQRELLELLTTLL